MFMRHNRAQNGAPQPERVADQDRPGQVDEERLSPNGDDLGQPQHRTFEPTLDSIEAINRAHYRGGLDDGDELGQPYGQHIPVGPKLGK